MHQRSTVTMSMRELHRLKLIQAVVDGQLRATVAADRLQLSARQVRRMTERYRLEGPVGLISRRRNRPGNRRLEEPLENQVVQILRDQYADFGPTLATEKLAERHQITFAKETVRRIQIAAGLWIPRKLRPPKVQQPRLRRACLGELVQIDGCEHRWFEERAPASTVLVYVDDATSRLMLVHFTGPVRELKSFRKVVIPTGEFREVEFELWRSELSFRNTQNVLMAEPGDFELWVSPSATTGDAVRFSLLAGACGK